MPQSASESRGSAVFSAGGHQLPLGKRTYILGILNLTPDSFSDGGRFDHPDQAADRIKRLADAGADILDIGAESTRPGSLALSAKEETTRLLPVLETARRLFSGPISVDTYKPEVAEAALAAGVMTSNDDNAGVYVSNAGDNGYPLFQISGWGEFCMSKTMENILKSTSTVDDPRMPIWFGKTVNYVNGTSTTAYQGLANGLSATDVTAAGATNYSYVWGLYTNSEWSSGKDISNYKIAKRMKVMNYAEVCLLKAEAALRGFSGAGSISDDYETGIKASFASERSDVTDASLYSTANDETYITTGNVKWDSSASTETKLKQIITQKWLALYPNGIEAWAEFRRTGYPELTPVAVSLESSINPSNDEFIKKLRYIDDEINSNPNASNTSLNKNKGDGMDVRVWWDTERYK